MVAQGPDPLAMETRAQGNWEWEVEAGGGPAIQPRRCGSNQT